MWEVEGRAQEETEAEEKLEAMLFREGWRRGGYICAEVSIKKSDEQRRSLTYI